MLNTHEKLSTEFSEDAVDWVINHAQFVLGVDTLPPTLSDTEAARILDVRPPTNQVWRCTGDRKIQYTKTGRSAKNNTLSVLKVLLESGDNKNRRVA